MDFVSIVSFILLIIIIIFYTFEKFPSFKDFLLYHGSVEYRFLFELHEIYKQKESNKWDYDNTYLEQVRNWLNKHLGKQGQYYELAEMIFTRFEREEFVRYYFSIPTTFRYYAGFVQMWKDMQNGDWQNRIYDTERILENILPQSFASNTNALLDFMKFVKEGWFDPHTGMYTNLTSKEYSSSALYRIGRRNDIQSIENIFAPIWNEKPSTIRSRWRRDKKSPQSLKKRDEEIDSILNK